VSNFVEVEPGLRERNKLKRRNAILDAALTVLDNEPASNLTVDSIATIAELSPATVYNLIGGRDEIVRAVMVRIIEHSATEMRAHSEAGHPHLDALWMSRLAIEHRSTLLVARSDAYRRLVAHLGGLGAGSMVLKGSDGKKLDAPNVHIDSMRHAQKKGMIRRTLDPVVFGTLVANGYNGTLLRWASGGVKDMHLLPVGRLGLVSIAAAACTSAHRSALEREMSTLNRSITAKRQ
jgi:AcrR family transcriptional regulator